MIIESMKHFVNLCEIFNCSWTIANLDITNQLVEVYINSNKIFTGYADKPKLNLSKELVTCMGN